MAENITLAVAANIRKHRESRKLTLDAASACTGVSRSMLAQIERGEANPTISVLWKIANGYRVSFTSLLEENRTGPVVLPKGEAMEADGGRYLNFPAFLFNEKTAFETCRIEIEPGGFLDAEPHLAGTEEFITLFGGQVEITVDGVVHTLSDGESIRFMADVPHSYRNPGQDRTLMSMILYYH